MHVNVAVAFWCLAQHFSIVKGKRIISVYLQRFHVKPPFAVSSLLFNNPTSLTIGDRYWLQCAWTFKRLSTKTSQHLCAHAYTQATRYNRHTDAQSHDQHLDVPQKLVRPLILRIKGEKMHYTFFSSLQLLIIVQSEPLPKNRLFLMRWSFLHNLIIFIQV